MSKDVSNQTIMVLAILTILISILGVATIFFETSKVSTTDAEDATVTSGSIRLEIAQPQETTSSGSLKLEIANANS